MSMVLSHEMCERLTDLLGGRDEIAKFGSAYHFDSMRKLIEARFAELHRIKNNANNDYVEQFPKGERDETIATLRKQLAIAVDALDDLQQEYDNWASVRKAHKALAEIRAAGGE